MYIHIYIYICAHMYICVYLHLYTPIYRYIYIGIPYWITLACDHDDDGLRRSSAPVVCTTEDVFSGMSPKGMGSPGATQTQEPNRKH